ncbi:hypothetical protein R3P38DRAFT_3266526 [Favolaschia claudopus]|uniref:Secreted protein n=1 Tax=Favolaschia claudopus TaxID=2862362 RepID=A0AAW0BTH6_9AGAR
MFSLASFAFSSLGRKAALRPLIGVTTGLQVASFGANIRFNLKAPDISNHTFHRESRRCIRPYQDDTVSKGRVNLGVDGPKFQHRGCRVSRRRS